MYLWIFITYNHILHIYDIEQRAFATMSHNKTYYGFYSPTMEQVVGNWLYKTMDGKEVTVTLVTCTQQHASGYADMQYLGQLEPWLTRSNYRYSCYMPDQHCSFANFAPCKIHV